MRFLAQAFPKRLMAASLVALALAVPNTSTAFSIFDEDQDLDIESNTWNQVLFYNYSTGSTTLSSVALGDRELSNDFLVFHNSFTGAFLYDYTEFQFTAGFYATTTIF